MNTCEYINMLDSRDSNYPLKKINCKKIQSYTGK